MGKVREFWKNNKKEILIGLGTGLIAAKIGFSVWGDGRMLIDKLNRAVSAKHSGSAVKGMLEAMEGANYMDMFRGEDCTIRKLGSDLVEWCTKNNVDLDTEVKGLVLFEKI